MGIPEFYGDYLKKNDQGIEIKQLPPGVIVHSLAIDTPGIIHAAAQKTWFYGEGRKGKSTRELKMDIDSLIRDGPDIAFNTFMEYIQTKIVEIVSTYAPRVLILAIDGRVPVAKIQQQRKRRYGTRQKATEDELLRFDSATISPGTKFMKEIDRRLQSWIDKAQKPNKKPYTDSQGEIRYSEESALPSHVIYSPYTVPGEAEHKIMNIWFSGQIHKYPVKAEDKSRVINILYGKDADLVLLSLAMNSEKVNNIFVVREEYTNIIDISALERALDRTGISPSDFVTIMSFIGNDFIPRQPSLKLVKLGIDEIVDAYTKTKTTVNEHLHRHGLNIEDIILFDEFGIIWEYMRIFIANIANKEIELLAKVFGRNKEFTNRSVLLDKSVNKLDDGTLNFSYNRYRQLWYDNALGVKGKEGDIQLLNSLLGDVNLNYDEGDIEDMCFHYLTMFSWTQRYYFYGDATWNIYYPYHHAPLLRDLNDFFSKHEIDKLNSSLNNVISKPLGFKGDYNMLHQLLAILPPGSLELFPQNAQFLMGAYSYISDLYPLTIEVDKDGTRSEMMYNYILPFAEMNRIIYASKRLFDTMDLSDWVELENEIPFDAKKEVRVTRNPRLYNLVRASSHKQKQSSVSEGSGPSSRRGRGSEFFRGRGSRGSRGRSSSSQSSQSRNIPEGERRPF